MSKSTRSEGLLGSSSVIEGVSRNEENNSCNRFFIGFTFISGLQCCGSGRSSPGGAEFRQYHRFRK